ncbi:MAG: MarR family winged helix-turn-helix transcriptional regulator [Pseudomonadota bacterium]
MKTIPARSPARRGARIAKVDFEVLAHFRYRLRQFLRFSEEVTQANGITPLQYQLMLQIKGFPGRDWASVTELAERLQSKHHGVVALVSRCETLGLVRRHASASDLRLVEVRLTPAGEECLDRLARLHRDELETLQGLLTLSADARGTEGD